ncbi:MAG: amidase [bacterium]|nr:amidase [bacterium]
MSDDVAFAPIGEVANRVSALEISPVELVTLALDRIRSLDPVLRAYITVFEEDGLAEARVAASDIANGNYRGPLHGIPVAVKDNVAVAGHPTTNGSVLWADHTTDFDAEVVTRLRRAGAILIGKNNMHEWGMGGTCKDMYFGTVRNPWDVDHIPGGSSGGSAVAVSAGMAWAAVGTDGWGSIRTPASYCGVVGLMPTHGLASRFGELPPTSSWHHTIGPITRTVGDAATMLDVMAGHDPKDPVSIQSGFEGSYHQDLGRGIGGLRVGLASSYFFDDALAEVVRAVREAARVFEELGAAVEEVDLSAFYEIPLALAAAQHESQSVLLPYALARPDGFATPEIRYRILAGEFVSATDHRRGMQVRNEIRAGVARVFERVDVVLAPCNSTVAFPIEAGKVGIGGGRSVDLARPGAQSRLTTRLTLPWNLVGVPAIAIPSGSYVDGLPVGLQLAARRLQEPLLLRVAAAYEAAAGDVRPPMLLGTGEAHQP